MLGPAVEMLLKGSWGKVLITENNVERSSVETTLEHPKVLTVNEIFRMPFSPILARAAILNQSI